MSTPTALPCELSEVSADLTTFLKGLDPTKTLLDVRAIVEAEIPSATEGGRGMVPTHGGLSGAMTRIHISYDDSIPATEGRVRPATVVCKSNRDTDQSRAHSKTMQLPREALFLRSVRDLQVACAAKKDSDSSDAAPPSPLITLIQQYAPDLITSLPAVYYSEGSMANGTKLILMEDFGTAKTVTVGEKSATVEGIQSGWLLGPHSILNRSIPDLAAVVAAKGWRVEDCDSEKERPLLAVCLKDLVGAAFTAAAELHGAFWMKGDAIVGQHPTTDGSSDSPSDFLRGAAWYLSAKEVLAASSASPSAAYTAGKTLYDGSMGLAHANWFAYLKRLEAEKAKNEKAEGESEAEDAAATYLTTVPRNVEILMARCVPSADASDIPAYNDFIRAAFAPAEVVEADNKNNNAITVGACGISRYHTLVHGDFHPGNMMVVAADATKDAFRVALLDWEVVGLGSGPQDVGQYIISHFTSDQMDLIGLSAVEAYADRLLRVLAAANACTSDKAAPLPSKRAITREVVVGALGRWAWLLGLMGGMETIPLQAMRYFTAQVDSFMNWATGEDVAAVLGVPVDAESLAALVGMCRP